LGRPTKATPELLQAILDDLARGLTREQACAINGVSRSNFSLWELRPEFEDLRARAQAARILALMERKQQYAEAHLDWKSVAWDLERTFKDQFADPNKAPALQVNQMFNHLHGNQAELEEARKRLDETKALQLGRKAASEQSVQEAQGADNSSGMS